MKSIFFISDAHLGSRALKHTRQQERRLCRFLDEIKDKASAVYMLGDIFDFWFEYRTVVPKGFTRFLGKVSELTDSGVEVHFFAGNHDSWCHEYLTQECGVIMHYEPMTLELCDQTFYLGHGDGLGDPDPWFRFLRSIFHNRFCRRLFRWLHPDLGMEFGLRWAKHSRQKHERCLQDGSGGDPDYLGEDREYLVCYAKEYLRDHPGINFFIFGHRHIPLDLMLSRETRLLLLGDWVSLCTYAVFDGTHMFLESYVEGETYAGGQQ